MAEEKDNTCEKSLKSIQLINPSLQYIIAATRPSLYEGKLSTHFNDGGNKWKIDSTDKNSNI